MARQAGFDRGETLDKALNLFWKKGYQGTSLKDLEQALDLRPGSIYAAFGSKERLFEETLDAYAARSQAALAEALEAASSPIAGLAAYVRRVGRSAAEPLPARACMLVKTVLETPEQGSAPRLKAEALMRALEARFADAFRAAQTAGEIAPDLDPEALASRLQMDLVGLRAYAQRSDAAPRALDLAEAVAQALEDKTRQS